MLPTKNLFTLLALISCGFAQAIDYSTPISTLEQSQSKLRSASKDLYLSTKQLAIANSKTPQRMIEITEFQQLVTSKTDTLATNLGVMVIGMRIGSMAEKEQQYKAHFEIGNLCETVSLDKDWADWYNAQRTLMANSIPQYLKKEVGRELAKVMITYQQAFESGLDVCKVF